MFKTNQWDQLWPQVKMFLDTQSDWDLIALDPSLGFDHNVLHRLPSTRSLRQSKEEQSDETEDHEKQSHEKQSKEKQSNETQSHVMFRVDRFRSMGMIVYSQRFIRQYMKGASPYTRLYPLLPPPSPLPVPLPPYVPPPPSLLFF